MSKSETIRARIEPALKAEAEAVLDKLGLSMTDAITVFLRQVALQRGLPFPVALPNAETQAALRDVMEGRNLKHWKSVDAMRKHYGDTT
ncbi:MAG: type II toxin-antitoxin system RelB/DinJ family antitoxin [bacterium]